MGNFIGIQRIYLSEDYKTKRVGLQVAKKIFGKLGGGYVVVKEHTQNNTLCVGEGVETVLSAYIQLKIEASYYACLSATNVPDVPARFDTIIVLADNDEAGLSLVQKIKNKYSKLDVSFLLPPNGFKDFNDSLDNYKGS